MKRIYIIYNPRSSRAADVKTEVLDQTQILKGYIIGKYKIDPTDVDQNATKFAKILNDGDLVISAGGDATAVIAVNAILKSDKDVRLAVLPYGNFNDLARTLRTKTLSDIFSDKAHHGKLYPLEIYINGEFFRYATCYVTIGMTAEAVKLYDTPRVRKVLKTNFGRKIGSYTNLMGWYFKNRRKKVFLPKFKLNSELQHPKTSDYAAINGRSMARVMKGGEDFKDSKIFRSETDRLTNFWRLVKLMTKSIFHRIPGSDTTGDILEFLESATVELQAEGENRVFKDIRTIEIKKGEKCLKTIEN